LVLSLVDLAEGHDVLHLVAVRFLSVVRGVFLVRVVFFPNKMKKLVVVFVQGVLVDVVLHELAFLNDLRDLLVLGLVLLNEVFDGGGEHGGLVGLDLLFLAAAEVVLFLFAQAVEVAVVERAFGAEALAGVELEQRLHELQGLLLYFAEVAALERLGLAEVGELHAWLTKIPRKRGFLTKSSLRLGGRGPSSFCI